MRLIALTLTQTVPTKAVAVGVLVSVRVGVAVGVNVSVGVGELVSVGVNEGVYVHVGGVVACGDRVAAGVLDAGPVAVWCARAVAVRKSNVVTAGLDAVYSS